jgi:uncharacterized protein DUF5681
MSSDSRVGYKKPPKKNQFQKGKSGNSAGKPKGHRNLKTDLEAELAEMIHVSEGGMRRAISKQRALLKSLTAKGLQGDPRAANTVLSLVQKLVDQGEDAPAAEEVTAEDKAVLAEFEERMRQRLLAELKRP